MLKVTEPQLLIKSANCDVEAQLRSRIQIDGFLSFQIHDNGGRPFLVNANLSDNNVSLLKRNYSSETPLEELPSSHIFTASVDEVWCGCGTYDDLSGGLHYSIGNTIIAISGKTVYVFSAAAFSFDLQIDEGEVCFHCVQ